MRLRGTRGPGRAVLLILLVIFVAAAALGAYADWHWWMPYEGVVITLAAVGLFVLALVVAVAPRARTVALAMVVGGLGLLAGQNLGPARPELRQSEGRITVELTSPRASSGQGQATCATHVESGELQVSGDSNLRIEVLPDIPGAPSDLDQREVLGFSLTVGDRWPQGPRPRPDNIHVSVFASSVDVEAGYTMVRSAPDSSLELEWSTDGGTIRFSGLHAEEPTRDSAVFEQMAGIAEWTCG